MQCTWPQLARLAFRGFARPSPTNCSTFYNRLATPSTSCLTSLKPACSSSVLLRQWRLYVTVQTLPDTLSPTTPPPPLPCPSAVKQPEPLLLDSTVDGLLSEESDKISFTHAVIGRTAAQAIRVSVQQGNLDDAYLIVRSLYHARLSNTLFDTHINTSPAIQCLGLLGESRGQLIPFDKRVSPHLPAHALLHALIRCGEDERASQLVQGMISMGTRVRHSSLEAVLEGLAHRSSNSPPNFFSPLQPLASRDIMLLKPHMEANSKLTGGALRILEAARRSRHQSTGRMYRYLITICIINGEIILASLLFGVLLRDWQARENAKAGAAAAAVSLLQPLSAANASTLPKSIMKAPSPKLQDLKSICSFITSNLTAPQTDQSSKLAFTASLQALVNLAHDMDKGRLSVNLEPLIVAMYKCPRTRETAWISPNDKRLQRVKAYEYLHDVLDRLISSLPERELEQARQRQAVALIPKHGPDLALPLEPINPYSYNALLHYTLRHMHSLDRARFVLTQMLAHLDNVQHVHQVKAKAATLNILDRATKDFFSSKEVEALMNAVGLCPPTLDDLLSPSEGIPLDTYALSTRISSLVRKGETRTVVEALPKFLPGLYPPATPPGTPWAVSIGRKKQWREDGLERAVLLGPVVFTALLNALSKAGRTGLAESVFLYGLEAEKKSFDLDTKGCKAGCENNEVRKVVIRPWCLPVHAYTTMIHIYNKERLKSIPNNPHAIGWGLTPEGTPLPHTKDGDGDLLEPVRRDVLARRMIVHIYQSMMTAPEALMARLEKLEEVSEAAMQASNDGSRKQKDGPRKQKLQIIIALGKGKNEFILPEPDIWFFESLLDIFVKMPDDPLLPGLVREMLKRGMAVSKRVTDIVKQKWGDAVLEVVVEGPKIVDRNRKPVGFALDPRPVWKKERVSVRSRLGWKRWTPEEQAQKPIDELSAEEKEKDQAVIVGCQSA